MKARIKITLKSGVLDPQGKAIHNALGGPWHLRRRRRSPGQVHRGRAGRLRRSRAKATVENMCKDLLANTVIENYSYEIVR